MIQSTVTPSDEPADAALRDALAQGDAMLQSLAPVMRHLLTGAQLAVFADEIIARVRGGVGDVARQLLDAVAEAGTGERGNHDQAALDALFAALADIPGFLGHVHALAVEWQLTERLQARLGLDPTLPPLLQALLTSDDAPTSALAMNLLAAQARFTQSQRRMQLPLNELPADLLHGALLAMRSLGKNEPHAVAAETNVRAGYDESRTRIGLIARLVTTMQSGAVAALSLTHAGVAIFVTALGTASGQDRDVMVLSTADDRPVRLALALRAAGREPEAIEEQLLTLHAEISPQIDWRRVGAERAADLLAAAVPPART
ncbi:MAG: hypothetical protein JWQ16_1435 [Novosphingobium sp.]|nr:hypothetical protein [Novosphingobium sp.]